MREENTVSDELGLRLIAQLESGYELSESEELPGPPLFLNMMLASDPEIRLRVLEMELKESHVG